MSPPNTRSRGKSVSKSSSKTGSSRCFSEFGRLFSELEFRISRQRMREKCRFPLRTPNFWFRKSRQKTIFFVILKIITLFIRKKKIGIHKICCFTRGSAISVVKSAPIFCGKKFQALEKSSKIVENPEKAQFSSLILKRFSTGIVFPETAKL